MKTIVEMQFGSHLYGTDTPTSDNDYKSVFVPDGRSILLQRAPDVLNTKRPKQPFEKNVAGEVDRECLALHRYLELVAEGQTVALDMLFAPGWAMIGEPLPTWRKVQAATPRLVSRRAASFVGYCRAQANKYGIKGSRVHAVRNIVAWFDTAIARHGHLAKLSLAADGIMPFVTEHALEHTSIVYIAHPRRPDPIPHLDCCNRKAPFSVSLKDARAIYARLLDEYGARALMAENNEGVDWKALSHAVRVGHEALELLATGRITFPLPNAAHVLAIKQGLLLYRVVAEEIEGLLARVEAAQAVSPLPERPDMQLIDDLVAEAYANAVRVIPSGLRSSTTNLTTSPSPQDPETPTPP